MIRILNVAPLSIGGVQSTIMNYYRNINREMIQFDFLCTHNVVGQEYEEEVCNLGGRVFHLRFRTNPLIDFSFHRSFIRLLKNNPEIRIIHIHGGSPARTSLYALLSKLGKVPVRIIHSHGAQGTFPFHVSMFRPLARICATHWLGCSTEAGQSLFGKKAWDKSNKTYLLKNARDLESLRFHPQRRARLRENFGIENQFIVLHVARIDPVKNQIFLLDAFANAVKTQPDMLLLIAGDGSLRKTLEDKVSSLRIENNVRFLGMRDDIPDLFQIADMFVLPSISEGLPGVAIEAQTAGLPCLLSDTISSETKVSGLAKFLPINNGSYIWAEYMLKYINYHRCDTLEDVRKSGYDIHDAVQELEKFYFDISEKR